MSAVPSRLSQVMHSVSGNLGHSVWRADQMGSQRSATVSSGFAALDQELPGGGWPASSLIEMLLLQNGIGEMRLMRPALATIAQKRKIVLIQPPHVPHIATLAAWGIDQEMLLMLRTPSTADALWSTEQVLRNGSCGAVLFWQPKIPDEALRRLQLASQGSETMFWLFRPMPAAQNPSPAPLRLAVSPAAAGVSVHVVKRRGPQHETPVYLPIA